MKMQLFLDKDVRPLQVWDYLINIFQWISIEQPCFIQIMRPEKLLHFQVFHWNVFQCFKVNFWRLWSWLLWNGKTLQKLDFLFFLWSITGYYVFISSDWWQHWPWIFPEGTFLRKYFWSIFLTLNIPRWDIFEEIFFIDIFDTEYSQRGHFEESVAILLLLGDVVRWWMYFWEKRNARQAECTHSRSPGSSLSGKIRKRRGMNVFSRRLSEWVAVVCRKLEF